MTEDLIASLNQQIDKYKIGVNAGWHLTAPDIEDAMNTAYVRDEIHTILSTLMYDNTFVDRFKERPCGSGSTYQMTGRSDPVNLGMFTVLPDGSASARVTFANVPVGKHMLVLEGTAPDGTPATYYQFIEVRYSQNDADGDGIMDTDDKCNFIRYWYDETTGKDVCSTSDADSKAENATPDMAVGNTLLNRSEKNTDLLTLDVISPQYLAEQSSNIAGVPDSLQPLAHKIDSSTIVSRERHNGLTLPLIALIIITVIIGCIWRKSLIKLSSSQILS